MKTLVVLFFIGITGLFGSSEASHAQVLIKGWSATNTSLDISDNFWGAGIDPSISTFPNSVYWPDFRYTATSSSGSSNVGFIICMAGSAPAEVQSNPSTPLTDSCRNLLSDVEKYSRARQYERVYDAWRAYIPLCYSTADASSIFIGYFSEIGGSIELKTVAGRERFIDWMFDTVLSVRNDDEWYCRAVPRLSIAYDNVFIYDRVPELAILKFVIDNPRCQEYREYYGKEYDFIRKGLRSTWSDSARPNDPSHYDSTLPSLHDIGLDRLLKLAVGHHYDIPGSPILLDARLTDNPAEEQSSVWVDVNREAWLQIEVLDLLGRKYLDFGSAIEPGERTLPLDLSQLPSGSYYVRLITANNEVRTLKLARR